MSDEFNRQMAANRAFYAANTENIKQTYAGQYVGIAFGRLIATDPDYFSVCRMIDGLCPPSLHHLVFHAEDDPSFEPVFTSFSGEFVPCEEPVGTSHPMVGTPSTSNSAPSRSC